jgi:ATP-binding cassette, subfamily B, bacterial
VRRRPTPGAAVGWTATNALRSDLARHCLGLDLGFHKSRTAGEMIERIDGDVTALSDFFAQFSVRVLGGMLLLVGILTVLWIENVWIGAALTLFTLLELAVLARTREVAVPATTLEREANAKVFGFIEERLAGIEDVRANGGGPTRCTASSRRCGPSSSTRGAPGCCAPWCGSRATGSSCSAAS